MTVEANPYGQYEFVLGVSRYRRKLKVWGPPEFFVENGI